MEKKLIVSSVFASVIISAIISVLVATSMYGGRAGSDSLPDTNITKVKNNQIETKFDGIDKRLSELYWKVMFMESDINSRNTATLDPVQKGYSVVNTNSGMLLVSVNQVDPYLDGYKITYHIGNPMFMTFNGFRLTVKYGRQFDAKKDGIDKFESWQKSLKEISSDLTDQLSPGSWNKVELIIPSTKAEDIRYLEVAIKTDQVALRQ